MPGAKEDVRDLLDSLPGRAGFGDGECRQEIREGTAETDRADLADHDEVKARPSMCLDDRVRTSGAANGRHLAGAVGRPESC